MKFEFTRSFSRDRQGTYPEIEFTVPRGTREITVRYGVEPPEATVDFGLADPCGLRGWSGGARREVTVTPANATPGYLPGLVRPGAWRAILGLYDVPDSGCEVRLEVTLREAGALRWYRGDLHAHTHHSDAAGSVADLVASALERGLDFLAVTDHNTTSHHAQLPPSSLGLIAGQEVTTYRGHYTALGPGPSLEFRHEHAHGVARSLEAAFHARMLRVLAHPKPTCPSCDWQWGLLERFDAYEVWNGPWATMNWVPRDRWVVALNAGLRLPAVGGSDRHQTCGWPDNDPAHLQVGSPTTWIRAASLAPGDLLNGVLEGRSAVSERPDGPLVWLETRGGEAVVYVQDGAGTTLRVFDQDGVRLEQDVSSGHERLEVPFERGVYLRAELVRPWLEAEREHVEAIYGLLPDNEACVAGLSSPVWRS